LVVVVLVVWGIYSLSNQKQVSEEPIKIGVIAPLTGDGAIIGEAHQKATNLALEEINDAGGIDGQKIKLIYEDGKCNGKDAASAAQKLINVDGVKIIIGGLCSSESLAAAPIADQNKVLLYSPGSSSVDLTGISDYFVRNFPSDATQGEILANYAFNTGGVRKMAVIQEQQDYTFGIYRAFRENFLSLGGEIFHEKFAINQTDFKTMLTKLKANKPDALFIISNTGSSAERIVQDLVELGWETYLFLNDNAAAQTEIVKRNADILEGAITAEVGVDLNNDKFAEFRRKYQKRYGSDLIFINYDPIFYDAMLMIRDGLLEVGNNPKKLAQWMRNVEGWQGASGEIDIKENGDRTSGHILKIIRDGEIVPYEN